MKQGSLCAWEAELFYFEVLWGNKSRSLKDKGLGPPICEYFLLIQNFHSSEHFRSYQEWDVHKSYTLSQRSQSLSLKLTNEALMRTIRQRKSTLKMRNCCIWGDTLSHHQNPLCIQMVVMIISWPCCTTQQKIQMWLIPFVRAMLIVWQLIKAVSISSCHFCISELDNCDCSFTNFSLIIFS